MTTAAAAITHRLPILAVVVLFSKAILCTPCEGFLTEHCQISPRLRSGNIGDPHRRFHALRSCIHIETLATQEPDQSQVHLTRELDCQVRGRRHGSQYRDSRNDRLLNNLETATPAHQQNAVVERNAVLKQAPANNLIHSVVPADIFTHHQQLARGTKQSRSVQTAGTTKDRLLSTQAVGKRTE